MKDLSRIDRLHEVSIACTIIIVHNSNKPVMTVHIAFEDDFECACMNLKDGVSGVDMIYDVRNKE